MQKTRPYPKSDIPCGSHKTAVALFVDVESLLLDLTFVDAEGSLHLELGESELLRKKKVIVFSMKAKGEVFRKAGQTQIKLEAVPTHESSTQSSDTCINI